MKSKKLLCVLSLIVCLSSSVPSYADINEYVRNAQVKYQEYQEKIDNVNSQVYSLNSSIEELLSSIDETEFKSNQIQNEIVTNEGLIEGLKKDIENREELKATRVREMYKSNMTLDYLTLFISSKSVFDLLSMLDGVNTIVNIDKNIIVDLEEDKKELNQKILELDNKKRELKVYKDRLNSEKESLEIKKAEQKQIIANLEAEKARFDTEVLEVAERQLVSSKIDEVDASNSASELTSLVSQLTALRDNQLSVDSVIADVNSAISNAQSKIESIRQQEIAANTPDINRGEITATGNAIVDFAYQFLGAPYVWGAVGPEEFDCSGLTSYVYRHAAGIEITRTTYTQINVGTPVSYSEMQPGDLVFTYENEHVGIYVGDGMYINATYPGSTVRVTPVTNFYAARRIL